MWGAKHTCTSGRTLVCMRTTMNLPDGLMAEAKARAARDGRTVTSLVEEGLRAVLAAPDDPTPGEPRLTTFGEPDGRFLVDILDKDALWEALDAPE